MEDKEEQMVIKEEYQTTSKYVDMNTLPKEFKVGVSLLARDLNREIAKLTLIRTKEYAEYIKNKSDLIRLTGELEEALEYWRKKTKR